METRAYELTSGQHRAVVIRAIEEIGRASCRERV